MNQLRILTVSCAAIFLWMACTTNENETTSLSDALHVVDDNPQEALKLLNGIADPALLSDCDQDQYMQYVVILTQARYMDYQDITADSLILDAQRYFAKTQNYDMAARASYYAAAYWHEGEARDKAIEYSLAAFHFAERAGNNLFMTKSSYLLSISYFNQEQWEEAMIYCQKTMKLYDSKLDTGHYRLDVTNMLGCIYREQQDPEQAYRYFDKGLKEAKNLNNAKYESRFLRQIGIIHRNKGEYQQAKDYFDRALFIQPDPEDMLRIYLSYAKLYKDMNLPDSTLYYLRMIENRIPEITYPHTRRDLYTELATYYQFNNGDGEKIAHYLQLANTEDLRIKKSMSQKKIEALYQQYKQLKLKRQTEGRSHRQIIDYGIISLLLLVFLLVIVEFNTQRRQKDKYKEMISQLLSAKGLDMPHFLLTGLRGIAKSTDDMIQKNQAYPGSPVWEQLLALRKGFTIQIAEYTKQDLKKLHNGRKVLPKLTPEDLTIIYLSQHQQRLLPDEYIGWMLGHPDPMDEYITLRKEKIRLLMAEAGMRDEDITMLLS